ncbi:MAG: penicillin-binding transpeptidase domain-containing protein, partial [Gemmatimonadota bacterium]
RERASLRDALAGVVARGTAAGSGGRDIQAAGKTGTAQNPHGPDHGWFIAFAPADRPEIIVGSIMEAALHGSTVAPWVIRVIRRYMAARGLDPGAVIEVLVPVDSAPRVELLITDTTTARR